MSGRTERSEERRRAARLRAIDRGLTIVAVAILLAAAIVAGGGR